MSFLSEDSIYVLDDSDSDHIRILFSHFFFNKTRDGDFGCPKDCKDNGIRLIKKPDAIAKNDKPTTGTKVLFFGFVQANVPTLYPQVKLFKYRLSRYMCTSHWLLHISARL